jgi:hypothetical protein
MLNFASAVEQDYKPIFDQLIHSFPEKITYYCSMFLKKRNPVSFQIRFMWWQQCRCLVFHSGEGSHASWRRHLYNPWIELPKRLMKFLENFSLWLKLPEKLLRILETAYLGV